MVWPTMSAGSRLIWLSDEEPCRTNPSGPFHLQRDIHLPDVIEREAFIEEPHERPDGAGRVVVLGLRQQQRRASLEVAQIDIIAERCADDTAVARHHQHHLGLRIIPGRFRMQARIHAGAHRRQDRRLGKDFGVRPDADFEILAPGILRNQHVLHMLRFGRARLQLRQVGADDPRHLGPNGLRRIRIAARPLLDHPFQHRYGEGDAGRLDHLQIDRGQ